MEISEEQSRMLEAISTAIEMEIDGKECYLAAGRDSGNEAGRELLLSLAEEEDAHRRHFEALYNKISQGHDWPAIDFQSERSRRIRTDLNAACQALGMTVAGSDSEKDAVQAAIEKEKQSYTFYNAHAAKAVYESEKQFYTTLANEEWQHELALVDYHEYLSDPAGWFVNTEHPSLDGG
ncbi:MAG: ferritin family protein [Dehalogenimonas sp.]|uniref:Ferritin family protein n=1 Tax=Candidatus Dehalogenimonas loeffleri TaxID=3127115 RepID=A0ABZ2J5I1_9CHLR|nr:ferritin family protein [Dehalogenimonas sp.]